MADSKLVHCDITFSAPEFTESYMDFCKEVGVVSPDTFIATVSNIYHELESKNYDSLHNIIEREKVRLRWIVKKVLANQKKEISILDYGCGTGLLTISLAEIMKQSGVKYKIDATDLSPSMIKSLNPKVKDASHYINPFVSDHIPSKHKYDLILTSSLIHHIPDIWKFTLAISNSLNENGYWIALHEPNAYKKIVIIDNINGYLKAIQRLWTKFKKRFFRVTTKGTGSILELTADQIYDQKLSNRKLSRREVRGLVDIHTINPHPGNFNIGYDGFSVNMFRQKCQQYGLKLVESKSYDCFKIDHYNFLTTGLSIFLTNFFRNSGTRIFMIIKKAPKI